MLEIHLVSFALALRKAYLKENFIRDATIFWGKQMEAPFLGMEICPTAIVICVNRMQDSGVLLLE